MPAESIQPTAEGYVGTPNTRRWDRSLRKHIAKIVFHELLNANAPLGVGELQDRTLLPEGEIREAISALVERGLCSDRKRRSQQPHRFVASTDTAPTSGARGPTLE